MPSERVLKYIEIQDGYAQANEQQRKYIIKVMEDLWKNMSDAELAYIAENPHFVTR